MHHLDGSASAQKLTVPKAITYKEWQNSTSRENYLTCSYKKKIAVENFSDAQLTIASVEVGSK
jgi:hypothetical protein